MHRSSVRDEILSCPRIAGEEFGRQQVAFETIAARAGENEVPGNVRATVRQRMDMIERCEVELEGRSAVHAAPAAIAHCRSFYRSLLRA